MFGVTFFGIFMTPVFCVLVRRLTENRALVQHKHAEGQDDKPQSASETTKSVSMFG